MNTYWLRYRLKDTWLRLHREAILGMLSDLVLFLGICLSGFVLGRQIPQSVRIDFHDESMYLTDAAGGFFYLMSDRSPLYVRFLSLYFHFIQDPTDVYYLNIQLLTVALPLLAYVLARILHAPRLPAFTAAFLLLISTGNAPLVPKSHHFATGVVLALLVASNLMGAKRRTTFGGFSVVSAFLSYVRPEQLLSVAAFLFLFLFESWKGRATPRSTAPYLLATVISLTFLTKTLDGLPWEGTRAGDAFQQSYALSYRDRIPAVGAGVTMSDEYVFQRDFGDAAGLLSAVFRNPGACIAHWAWNFRRFLKHCYELLSNHYVMADTIQALRGADPYLFFSLYVFLLFPLLSYLRRQKDSTSALPWKSEKWQTTAYVLGIFCLPSLVISIGFCSWERYLAPAWFSALLLVPAVLARETKMPPGRTLLCSILAVAVAWVITPRNLSYAKWLETDPPEENSIAIRDEFLSITGREGKPGSSSCLVNLKFYATHLKCEISPLTYDPYNLWEKPELLLEIVSKARPEYILFLLKKWPIDEAETNLVAIAERGLRASGNYTLSFLKSTGRNMAGHLWTKR